MIDQTSQFFAMLTAVGEAKHANAIALGVDWMFTDMGVGDANGANPIPDRQQTQLINEWRRAPLNQIRVDAANPNVVITEQIIPADVGGKWIREIGLYDIDGDLVAVANCAPSFKPLLSQGSGKTQVVRMNFIVTSAASIVLKIDPAVVLATREYVDQKIREEIAKLDHKESVLYATTGAIVLSGLGVQTGGDWAATLMAGARVLVKDQAAAKDNGLYSAAAGAWVRTFDADSNADVTSGLVVAVEQGTTLADTRWQLVTDGNVVLGTTPLTFQTANNPTATTAPQFDNSKLISTTEFVRRQGVQYSGSGITSGSAYSMNASHIGGVLQIYGGLNHTITLPPLTGVPNGATVTLAGVMGAGGTATLVAPAGKALRHVGGTTMGAPVTLRRDEVAVFQAHGNGGEWRLIGGSMMVRYAASSPDANFITLPQFDTSQALATTEFVRRALGNRSQCDWLRGSRAIAPADFGGEFVISEAAGSTVTFPDLASVPTGATIKFVNLGSSDCTFNCAAGDFFIGDFDSSGTAPTFKLSPSDDVSITCYAGAHWLVVGRGSVFAGSGAYGVRSLGGGLILQWGMISGPTNPPNDRWDLDIVFPRAFPSVCFGVVGVPGIAHDDLDVGNGEGGTYRSGISSVNAGIATSVGFEAAVSYLTTPADARIYTWHALGR